MASAIVSADEKVAAIRMDRGGCRLGYLRHLESKQRLDGRDGTHATRRFLSGTDHEERARNTQRVPSVPRKPRFPRYPLSFLITPANRRKLRASITEPARRPHAVPTAFARVPT